MLMDMQIYKQIEDDLKAYLAPGVEDLVDYQKFYLYSIMTHSTAIEGSTVTSIENQLLLDEGIAATDPGITEENMYTNILEFV